MNTAPRRSLIAAALIACCASILAGVDLTPPEVPNPYGTSEGRAIRDFLEETYKIKASDKLSLDELRALYRKTWNNDQEKRYLDENNAHPADPAWVKAYNAERDQEQRLRWAGVLEKMGVKAPADASVDQLRELAAKTKREQDEALEKKRLPGPPSRSKAWERRCATSPIVNWWMGPGNSLVELASYSTSMSWFRTE